MGSTLSTMTLVLLCIVPGTVRAGSLVELGDRVFLVGEIPRATQVEPDFLPLNDVDWLHDILDRDPMLGPMRVVFLASEARTPPDLLFSERGIPGDYGNSDLVPKEYRVPELRVEVSSSDAPGFTHYLAMEKGNRPSWLSTCFVRHPAEDDRSTLSTCGISSAYPYDPGLLLTLRIYGPPEPDEIGAIFPGAAERMVEILTCLDVTEDVPATDDEARLRLSQLIADNPDLRDCEIPYRS